MTEISPEEELNFDTDLEWDDFSRENIHKLRPDVIKRVCYWTSENSYADGRQWLDVSAAPMSFYTLEDFVKHMHLSDEMHVMLKMMEE